jgi:hypothetical protein
MENININEAFLKIKELYRNGYLPLIDGIITKDKYTKIDVEYNYKCKGEIVFKEECEFIDNEILLQENCSSIDRPDFPDGYIKYKDFAIGYGEGSWGGDGYIVVMDKMYNVFCIMFHQLINPIEEIKLKENKIIGINNCYADFEFQIDWKCLK